MQNNRRAGNLKLCAKKKESLQTSPGSDSQIPGADNEYVFQKREPMLLARLGGDSFRVFTAR